MTERALPSHERVTNALEFHGDLFQRRCVQEIIRAGASVVDTELPVHVAHDSSVVDIWAEAHSRGVEFQVIIECKRRHPDFRVWAFLGGASSGNIEFLVIYLEPDSTTSSAEEELLVFSDMRGPQGPVTGPFVEHGREVGSARLKVARFHQGNYGQRRLELAKIRTGDTRIHLFGQGCQDCRGNRPAAGRGARRGRDRRALL